MHKNGLESAYLTDGLERRSRRSERGEGETEATVPNFLATRYRWQTRDAPRNFALSGAHWRHDSNVAQLKLDIITYHTRLDPFTFTSVQQSHDTSSPRISLALAAENVQYESATSSFFARLLSVPGLPYASL